MGSNGRSRTETIAVRTALGVVTSTLILASCSDEGAITVLRPKMVLNPEPGTILAFDEVILTRSKAGPRSIVVSSRGDGVLSIESVELEGAGAAAFRISSQPTTLLPGQDGEIFVRFEPGTPGQKDAVLRIRSNDPNQPDVTYPLTGPVREPCVLFADHGRMIFQVGEEKTLTLSSLSTNQCVIDRIFTDRDVFPLGNEPSVPHVIKPGESFALTITHRGVSTQLPGIPVRELQIRESEGSEITVLLEGEPPLFGCLSAFPLEIVFPQTEVGLTRRQRVTVTNRCGRPAEISSVIVSRGYDAYSADGEYPATIEPGGTFDVWITYAPQLNPLGDQGRLTINTNDAANPRFRVRLSGTAAVPQIEAFPYELEFGTVIFRNPGGPAQRSECASGARFAHIYSTGSAPLTIQDLEVDTLMGDPLFEVVGVSIEGAPVANFDQPFRIPAGESAQVALQFFPTRSVPELHESHLRIHHNGSIEPALIQLRGIGTSDGPVTDTFTQLEGPKVDILWVIDNSCSMYDEQARLIDNLSQFINYADAQNADYQMGVIVTDSRSPEAGKLEFCYPHPRIVRHDYADREEAFRCLFDVGVNGPYIEAGMGASMRAIQRALRVNDDPVRNPNIGFLRDDASLAIVWMSDEDDQSLEGDDLLHDFFTSVKGANRVSAHSIAGPVSEPCATRLAAPGYRYFGMTQRMNGVFHNICLTDWQPVLRNLGLNVFVPIEEWDLSQAADPASVTVTVDGAPVIWDAANGFTYSASRNVVSFHGAAVPQPGQAIDVSYTGNCRP